MLNDNLNGRLVRTMRCQCLHFIGIGGSGMNGIAELLLHYGYKVTGSDLKVNRSIERLRKLGAKITIGHKASNVKGAEVVVCSSAIDESNPELVMARKLHLPIIPRAQMLAEIMRFSAGIAVAGTHGKTTTTSLLAHLLEQGGLDPAYVIGGILNSSQRSSHAGAGDFFIVEADESDGSFLRFSPVMAILTNIDRDHLNNYHMDMEELKLAFIKFIQQLPFYGLAVVCSDDAVVKSLLEHFERRLITYGFKKGADVHLSHFEQQGFASKVVINAPKLGWHQVPISFNLAGRHNALNAVAALIIATIGCGLPLAAAAKSLENFSGVGRRMQRHGWIQLPSAKVLVVEDYGHHPHEIQATIEALRGAYDAKRRLAMLFQPHRFSRTADLWQEFVEVLSKVDLLVLTDIYAASEKPMLGINSSRLANEIRALGSSEVYNCPTTLEATNKLTEHLQDGDILLVQGAGDVNLAVQFLMERYPNAN